MPLDLSLWAVSYFRYPRKGPIELLTASFLNAKSVLYHMLIRDALASEDWRLFHQQLSNLNGVEGSALTQVVTGDHEDQATVAINGGVLTDTANK